MILRVGYVNANIYEYYPDITRIGYANVPKG